MPTIEELQNKLKKLTRKTRSDKGRARGPNSVMRSDIGQKRSVKYVRSPVSIYAQIKSHLLSLPAESFEFPLSFDENGYYMPVITKTERYDAPHSFVSKGKEWNRDYRYKLSREIDLEQRRFEALQYLAIQYKSVPENYLSLFSYEIQKYNTIDTLLLFSSHYALPLESAFSITYEKWHEKQWPGSISTKDITKSRAYINEQARVRRELISKQDYENRKRILAENVELSMNDINLLLKKSRDLDKVEREVEEHMKKWVCNDDKLRKE